MKKLIFFAFVFALAACSVDEAANPGRRCNTSNDCNAGTCYNGFCLNNDAGFPDAEITDLGLIDGGEPCSSPGYLRDCYNAPIETSSIAPCRPGKQECRGGYWGPCIGEVLPELEICDGIDNDCNRAEDDIPTSTCSTGQRGVCARGISECLNGRMACTPTATASDEICDNEDNDCDGDTDEDVVVSCYSMDGMGCAYSMETGKYECQGLCKPGMTTCTLGQFGPCNGEVLPEKEDYCGEQIAVDDNCNGTANENCDCDDGVFYACYTGPAGTSTVPPCQPGEALCMSNNLGVCAMEVTPVFEACDNEGVDNDCDGDLDDVMGRGTSCTDTSTAGICQDGTNSCVNGAMTCVTTTARTETCNYLDDDCDGTADEAFDFATNEDHCGDCNQPCDTGLTCCGGQCVDLTTNPDFCGSCETDCGEDRLCCGSMCVNPALDELNCNACGTRCPENFSCCNGQCLDTRTSTQACGNCETQCTAGGTRCCGSSCELVTDPACTGCPMTCQGNETCCAPINPVCTNRMTDRFNCGACGNRCPNGQLCCGGNCVPNNATNCGTCGNACDVGIELCCSGACIPVNAMNCASCGDACIAGESCCVTGCETTNADDSSNCGGCGINCLGDTTCSNGTCCAEGWTGCGAPSGQQGTGCRDLQNNNNNCGGCGVVCPFLTGCCHGSCRLLSLGC